MKCKVCNDPIEPGQPFYEFVMHAEGREIETTYLGSMECFVLWTKMAASHFIVEHLMRSLIEADEAVDRSTSRGGDPSQN